MNYTIQTFHPEFLDETAALYQHVNDVRDYEGVTGYEASKSIVAQVANRDDFLGVIAVDKKYDEVIGYAWGYGTPTENKRITAPVIKHMGPQWVENTFMVTAFGMHFEQHSPELGKDLHDALAHIVREGSYDRMRIRLNLPRLDNLPSILDDLGWQDLKSVAHLSWMGKQLV